MNPIVERHRSLFGDIFHYRELPHSLWLTQQPETTLTRLRKENFSFQKIPFSPQGYYATNTPYALGATPLYLLGQYTLQEAAAQFPAIVLDPKPDELVVDMCAAPGMKTIQMATLMQNTGTIIACDVKNERLFALQNNIERCGIGNCMTILTDARVLQCDTADKVLLDAPCSGNPVTDKDWLHKRTFADFKKRSELQKSLLAKGIMLLKKGGTLVYATCSFEPEENEEVIDWALSRYHVTLETITASWGKPGLTKIGKKKLSPELAKTWRFFPPQCQGFFVAKLRT